MILRDLIFVAVGGAVGAVARYSVGMACLAWLGPRFPWGTLVVNVAGCFLLGFLTQASSISNYVTDAQKLIIGTGFLGALTTFSTFGVESIQTWNRSPWLGIGNVMANLMIGFLAAGFGMYVATQFSAIRGGA